MVYHMHTKIDNYTIHFCSFLLPCIKCLCLQTLICFLWLKYDVHSQSMRHSTLFTSIRNMLTSKDVAVRHVLFSLHQYLLHPVHSDSHMQNKHTLISLSSSTQRQHWSDTMDRRTRESGHACKRIWYKSLKVLSHEVCALLEWQWLRKYSGLAVQFPPCSNCYRVPNTSPRLPMHECFWVMW